MANVMRFGVEVEDTSGMVEYLPHMFSSEDQDLFVLGITDYKLNGTYVEIGGSMPRDCNNTYLLEQFNWKGISLDIRDFEAMWLRERMNKFIPCNAKEVNYKKLFSENFTNKVIDYLSLDIDEHAIDVLPLIPFDEYKFNVITVEHGIFRGNSKLKTLQKEILNSYNYINLVEDVPETWKHQFNANEDWWVSHEMYKNTKKIKQMYSFDVIRELGFKYNRMDLLTALFRKKFNIKSEWESQCTPP